LRRDSAMSVVHRPCLQFHQTKSSPTQLGGVILNFIKNVHDGRGTNYTEHNFYFTIILAAMVTERKKKKIISFWFKPTDEIVFKCK